MPTSDGYKSAATFGGQALGAMIMNTTSNQSLDKVSLYRDPMSKAGSGVGVFEHIGGDLQLVKPGMEFSDTDTLKEVKNLCVKIYRSTNMRYQSIAKLVMRNKADELRHMIQTKFEHSMPRHMSMVMTKINVQNGMQQVIFADGPDNQI